MFEFQSQLFQGDDLLQAIADDAREPDGSLTRISRTQHSKNDSVTRVQEALLTWRPDCLPVHGADGQYGDESAAAVRTFKIEELSVPPAEVIDDVGPRTVQRLDAIRAAAEAPPPAPTLFIRRSAWGLARTATAPSVWDPVTLAYAKAVQTMQARPASDPTSWAFQAAIHASFAAPPAGVRWNECQHQQWFFLPWHRMYLHFFERIVRAAVVANGGPADFALPYWDYEASDSDAALPPAFRADRLPDGTANPLLVPSPQRSNAMNIGGRIPLVSRSSAAAMGTVAFAGALPTGFGGARSAPAHFLNFSSVGALENTPHNVIHGLLGGRDGGNAPCQARWMGDPRCAALDPIFWLHHAQIDRLWNGWLAAGNGRAHPSDSDWQTAKFTFHDETGTQVTMRVDAVLNTETQLRYRYEDQPSFTPATAPVTPPPTPPRLVAATEQPFDLAGDAARVSLAVPAEGAEVLANDVVGGAARAVLNVEDISPESDPTVPYAVYVVLPDGERRHVGNVALFGIEAMRDPDQPHEGATGFRHSFDVTELVNEVGDPANLGAGEVTLEFAPLEPELPPGAEPEAAEGETRAAAPTMNVGRVSLFVS